MSGWAAVPARKVVAAMRQERWTRETVCPESLAVVQLSCLLEVEELREWSVSKLADQWGWSRKKATRVIIDWAGWFEREGPSSGRALPAWLAEIVARRNSESTAEVQAEHREGTPPVEVEPPVSLPEEQEGRRKGTEEAPRARSYSPDVDSPQPETKTGSGFAKPEVLSPEGQVYREWEERYRAFRNANAKRQRSEAYAPTEARIVAVRQALQAMDPESGRPYRPEELVLLLRYAFEAPTGAPGVDWWRKDNGQYLGLENLMVVEKLPTRMQSARDWAAGDLGVPRHQRDRGSYEVAARSASATPSQAQETAFERKRLRLASGGAG